MRCVLSLPVLRRHMALLPLLGFAWCQPAISAVTPETLAQSPTWIKLVHYEESPDSPTGWRSAVHTPAFFLDGAHGRTDPQSELQATLQAIATPPKQASDDEHAQCRFPARTAWLKLQLGADLALPAVSCPKWQAWAGNGQIGSVSLVLASGFLGNPASYYGHTLLKFNVIPAKRQTALQDPSVSYGVIEDGQDNPLVYITKGILGGYDGGFSEIAYYFHHNQYGEIELRDLWEYELNLTPEETAFVAAHAWEVLDRRYQYFFFRRNCAFRMAEIIQIIDGISITPANRPWTIPQATIQTAAKQTRPDGQPLLRSVRYVPSRQSRFFASYKALSGDETKVFFDLVDDPSALGTPAYQALTPQAQRAVVDATLDYHQFIADPTQRSSGKLHPVYVAALAERYRLPAAPKSSEPTPPGQPHTGRAPGWLQLGTLHDNNQGASAFLRVRAAYYDPLDSEQGHVANSGLTMGDIQLRAQRQRLQVDQLDLLVINSANPGVTGLPGDRGQVWQLKAGAEPAKPGCAEDCLTARLQGDIGMGRRLVRGLFASARVGGALQSPRMEQGAGYAKAGVGMIWRPQHEWGVHMELENRWPWNPDQPHYLVRRVEARWAFSTDYDLRIRHESSTGWRGGSRTFMGIGRYW